MEPSVAKRNDAVQVQCLLLEQLNCVLIMQIIGLKTSSKAVQITKESIEASCRLRIMSDVHVQYPTATQRCINHEIILFPSSRSCYHDGEV